MAKPHVVGLEGDTKPQGLCPRRGVVACRGTCFPAAICSPRRVCEAFSHPSLTRGWSWAQELGTRVWVQGSGAGFASWQRVG